ncbi:hypothetical protein XI09_05285 [Bradyrhizobium sp. CCBAU 11386]|uniref:hypothetical protein n=1 Tax=Bradyrhizobium sp. CCBAU 11386 TaxID=1630837 RepID=UPI0023024569|nr:hypothetical protein [Bradyrhizobium sp. CCBAU 11386]MDA9504185.1 hypothetical protein [Bradyrhizobium sp. CCBAU 11386]
MFILPSLDYHDMIRSSLLAANVALEMAWRHSDGDQYILFIEDDVVFSSKFAHMVTNTYLGPETGFLTLYLPGHGYQSHIIDPTHFYGTQSILFTRKAVGEIVAGRDEMMTTFLPGYDIRWSRFLAHKGYVLYCRDRSYVQHLAANSRLHDHGRSHASALFEP